MANWEEKPIFFRCELNPIVVRNGWQSIYCLSLLSTFQSNINHTEPFILKYFRFHSIKCHCNSLNLINMIIKELNIELNVCTNVECNTDLFPNCLDCVKEKATKKWSDFSEKMWRFDGCVCVPVCMTVCTRACINRMLYCSANGVCISYVCERQRAK